MSDLESVLRQALLDAADRIEELEKERPRCCKGCPDCIGIGVHHQIRALNDRIEELEAALRAAEAEGHVACINDEGEFYVENYAGVSTVYPHWGMESAADRIEELERERDELLADRLALVNLIYARDGIVTQDAVIEDGAS